MSNAQGLKVSTRKSLKDEIKYSTDETFEDVKPKRRRRRRERGGGEEIKNQELSYITTTCQKT